MKSTPPPIDVKRFWRLGSLSRRAIGRRIHLDHSLVGRILSGERRPSVDAVNEMAPLLKLSADQFIKLWMEARRLRGNGGAHNSRTKAAPATAAKAKKGRP